MDDENIKPFSMSRFATLWHCECEFKVESNVVTLYEPLLTDEPLTKDFRAYWNNDHIDFWGEDRRTHIRVNRHLMFSGSNVSPNLLMLQDGTVCEVTTGQVMWRESHGRWFVVWKGYKHTRFALMAAEALKFYIAAR